MRCTFFSTIRGLASIWAETLDLVSEWLDFGVLGYLESFDGGEGFEIGDRDWKLGDLIVRDLWDLEAELITAHKSASSRSLSSVTK